MIDLFLIFCGSETMNAPFRLDERSVLFLVVWLLVFLIRLIKLGTYINESFSDSVMNASVIRED